MVVNEQMQEAYIGLKARALIDHWFEFNSCITYEFEFHTTLCELKIKPVEDRVITDADCRSLHEAICHHPMYPEFAAAVGRVFSLRMDMPLGCEYCTYSGGAYGDGRPVLELPRHSSLDESLRGLKHKFFINELAPRNWDLKPPKRDNPCAVHVSVDHTFGWTDTSHNLSRLPLPLREKLWGLPYHLRRHLFH